MGDIFNELLIALVEQSQAYMNELYLAHEEQNVQVPERIFHSIGSSRFSRFFSRRRAIYNW